MSDLSKRTETLPERIEKLKNFIAIRRREITAYRAKIRALDDIGLIEKRKEVLNEAQNKAEEVLGAEAELGKLLIPGGSYLKGTSGKFKGKEPLPSGITKKQSHEVQKINNNWLIIENYMGEMRKTEQIATHTGAIKEINIKFRPKTPPMLKGEYFVLYADPPWQYEHPISDSRRIEKQYPTLELENIIIQKLPSAKNAILFLWSPASIIKHALEVMEAWGFNFRTTAIWDKESIGPGYWFRTQHEILLVGIKGDFHPPQTKNRVSSVYREKRSQHSKKPEYYYGLIEKMYPGYKYIELFARPKKKRKNWEYWGYKNK